MIFLSLKIVFAIIILYVGVSMSILARLRCQTSNDFAQLRQMIFFFDNNNIITLSFSPCLYVAQLVANLKAALPPPLPATTAPQRVQLISRLLF